MSDDESLRVRLVDGTALIGGAMAIAHVGEPIATERVAIDAHCARVPSVGNRTISDCPLISRSSLIAHQSVIAHGSVIAQSVITGPCPCLSPCVCPPGVGPPLIADQS